MFADERVESLKKEIESYDLDKFECGMAELIIDMAEEKGDDFLMGLSLTDVVEQAQTLVDEIRSDEKLQEKIDDFLKEIADDFFDNFADDDWGENNDEADNGFDDGNDGEDY